MPHVKVERLTKRFPSANGSITALQDVSVELAPGRIWAIVGDNGAGKTSLLKILAGVLRADAGSVYLDGNDVTRLGKRLAMAVGLAVSDTPGFYERLSGRHNLEFFGALYGLTAADVRASIESLEQALALGDPDRPYQTYSAGLKQRWLLARSLLHQPALILWDEPTRSQDPQHAAKIRALISNQLRKPGSTVIMATHHREDLATADGIVWLSQGKLRAFGERQLIDSDAAFISWWRLSQEAGQP